MQSIRFILLFFRPRTSGRHEPHTCEMIILTTTNSSLLASKLSKSIGIIHKSRFFLSTHSPPTLYNSVILSYLYYCNLAWGGTYKTNLQRIVILQKRALGIVNHSSYNANTGPIFKKLTLLKFHDTHFFQLGLCFHLRTLHSLPSSITCSLCTVQSIIIILGMPTLFACHCVQLQQTPDCFQLFITKVQSFTIL